MRPWVNRTGTAVSHVSQLCSQAATAVPAQARAGGSARPAAGRAASDHGPSHSLSRESAGAEQPAVPSIPKPVSKRRPLADRTNVDAVFAAQVCSSLRNCPVLSVGSLMLAYVQHARKTTHMTLGNYKTAHRHTPSATSLVLLITCCRRQLSQCGPSIASQACRMLLGVVCMALKPASCARRPGAQVAPARTSATKAGGGKGITVFPRPAAVSRSAVKVSPIDEQHLQFWLLEGTQMFYEIRLTLIFS